MLELERLLTQQEFVAMYTVMMGAVQQAESQGIIPANLIRRVATPFDVPEVPVIPDGNLNDIGNAEIKIQLIGEVGINIVKHQPPEGEE